MAASLPAPGCGSDDEYVVTYRPEVGRVEATVAFPDEWDQRGVAAVHMWVLTTDGDAAASLLCAQLVGGDLEPHDLSLRQQAEVISDDLLEPGLESGEIGTGPVIVYVDKRRRWKVLQLHFSTGARKNVRSFREPVSIVRKGRYGVLLKVGRRCFDHSWGGLRRVGCGAVNGRFM